MNNAFLAQEQARADLTLEAPKVDIPALEARQADLVAIVEALQHLQTTKDWRVLKMKVFDQLEAVLEGQIALEAKKEIPDPLKLNRLSGQLKWASTYSDLSKLEQVFKVELTKVKQLLHGKE